MKNFKIIGLMLTRDDIEVLNDWLNIYNKYFDKIFCLDGSTRFKKESKNILLKYDIEYSHDNEYDNLQKKDHTLRSVVYKKIKEYIINDRINNNKIDHWIVIIHPDEFYLFEIKKVINIAYLKKTVLINFNNCHNIPQKKEIEEWKKTRSYKVFKHFVYPGCVENRIFKYSDDLYYDDITHSKVIPHKLNPVNAFIGGKILHYKIQGFDDLFTSNGEFKTSCWSTLSSHYPKNHNFNKIEDFILDKPAGVYKNNKIFKLCKNKNLQTIIKFL